MNRLLLRLVAAVLLLPATQAFSKVEAPDHVLYGNVTLFGQPAPAGSVIEMRRADGSVIDRYPLGRDSRLAGQYSLRVPMDTVEPRVDGRARTGDPVKIYVGSQLAGQTSVGLAGVAVRLDLDPQGLGVGPAVAIANLSLLEGNAGSHTATLPVTMNTTSASPVTVSWGTQNGTATGGASCAAGIDFVSANTQLVIPAGALGGQIDVIVCGDVLVESSETFNVLLTAVDGGVLAQPLATVTLQDDDNVPSLAVANVRALEPASGSSVVLFRPHLSRSHDIAVSFAWTTQNGNAFAGSDYLAASGTVTLAPGEVDAEIPITVLADGITEPDESFRIVLSNPQNVALAQPFGSASIVDPNFDPALETDPGDDVVGGPGGIPGLTEPSSLALSPDGAHAYATSESQDNLLHFTRDANTGKLTFVKAYSIATTGFEAAKLNGPKDLKLSPDGSSVYVAAANDNAVVVLSRDTATGTLAFVANQVNGQTYPNAIGGQTTGLLGATALQVSSDGAQVYAAGATSNAIVVFNRDAATGTLAFVEAETNDANDATDAGVAVVGLSAPSSIVLSPDGSQVYVAARFGNAVVAFDRNETPGAGFGKLSFLTSYRNGLAGVSSIGGAIDLALSADGRHLYVAAESDNAVVLFKRDAAGVLTWTQAWKRNDPGIVGMQGPQGIAVAPDGREVFVTGFADSSLTVFRRQGGEGASAGSLSVHQTVFDGEGGMEHLGGPAALAVSPDNKHLYVAANVDNAIVLFRRLSWDVLFEDEFE